VKRSLIVAVPAALALLTVGPLYAAKGENPKQPTASTKYGSSTNGVCNGTATGGSDNLLSFTAPDELWPPNHKYFTGIQINAVDGDGSGNVDLASSGTHNQYDDEGQEWNGSGNTGEDTDGDGLADDVKVDPAEKPDGEDDGATEGYADSNGDAEGADNVVLYNEADDDGNVETTWWAVRERSGRGVQAVNQGTAETPDRVYEFMVTATFDDEECTGTFSVTVPHDQGKRPNA